MPRNVGGAIVPKTLARSFTYVDRFTLSPNTANTLEEKVYLANGMFDPEVALGGHKPYGMNQWMAWYDHFTVVSSHITTQYVYKRPGQDVSSYGGICTLRLDDDGDLETVPNLVLEMPGTAYKVMTPTGRVSLKKSFNAKRFFGGSSKVGNSTYKGSLFTDPTEKAYYHIGFTAPSSDDPAGGFGVEVVMRITYNVMLTERKEVAQS